MAYRCAMRCWICELQSDFAVHAPHGEQRSYCLACARSILDASTNADFEEAWCGELTALTIEVLRRVARRAA